MNFDELKQGDEVVVFDNYGRSAVRATIAELTQWAIKMTDGTSYARWDFRSDKKLAVVGSPEYELAVMKHEAKSAISVLNSEDAINNPEILAALKKCVDLLGDKEYKRRHGILVSMGASTTLNTVLYRDGTITYA